jgi:hypothetical protein
VFHLRHGSSAEAIQTAVNLRDIVTYLPLASDYYSINFTSLEAGFRTLAIRKMLFIPFSAAWSAIILQAKEKLC